MLPPSVFFIDFEAFQHGGEDFSVKELCIVDIAKPMKALYYMYLPPCDWDALTHDQRRTYNYAYRALHRLSWDEGYTRFCTECLHRDMDRYLFGATNRESSVFYVIGRQKTEFLQRILPAYKFVNYQEAFNVSSFKDLPESVFGSRCLHRAHGDRCAVLKCYRMLQHFISI
jgi:hypothetical protein